MRVPPLKPVRLLRTLGIVLLALPALGQNNMGELRLKVTDLHGLGVKTAVCQVNEYQNTFVTDDAGVLIAKRLPFGVYRVRPPLAVDVSAGAEVYKDDRFSTRLQADVENLNNRLNVLDFGGLFSGNATAPQRSYSLRLQTSF